MPRYKLLTELYYSGQWQDISSYLYDRDKVSVTRAAPDEQTEAAPGEATMTLNHRDGRWNPRDPRSPLFGLIGRNTPIRSTLMPQHVTGPFANVTDTFDRTVASGWGTEPVSGHTYTGFFAGAGTTSSVSAGQAHHGILNAATYRGQVLQGIAARSVTVAVTFAVVQATGGPLEPANLMLRGTSIGVGSDSYVLVRVQLETTNAITLKCFAADGTDLGTVNTGLTHAGAGTPLRVEARAVGHRIEARIWNPTGARPVAPTGVFTDPSSTVRGWVGVRSGIATGNTNTKPVDFIYDDFTVVCEETRFTGEVSQWPPHRDRSGKDVTVSVQAAGPLRRIGAGTKPIRSPMVRFMTRVSSLDDLIAYWPCEDGSQATLIAPGIAQVSSMATRDVDMATDEGFAGSLPLPVLGATGRVSGRLRVYPSGSTFFHTLLSVPAAGMTDLAIVADLNCTNGSVPLLRLRYGTLNGGSLNLYAIDNDGNVLDQTGFVQFVVNGLRFFAQIRLEQSGSDISVVLKVWKFTGVGLAPTVSTFTDTFTGLSFGRVSTFRLGSGTSDTEGMSLGHISISSVDQIVVGLDQALAGYAGEAAGRRILRLCEQSGVLVSIVGDPDATEAMGPERGGKFLELVGECATTDAGLLGEERDDIGLLYRTRRSLYNQAPALLLDYTAAHVIPPFEPMPDDQLLRNDVRVDRPGGSHARAVLATGPLSTQAPPAGVGSGYEDQVDANVASDRRLPDQARWRLHHGTWDEERYPSVTVRLENPRFRASPTLSAGALAVDPGDVVGVDNAPDTPDAVRMMVRGTAEDYDLSTFEVTYTAVPSGPFDVGVRDDDGRGKRDTGGSEVARGLVLPGASGDYVSTPDTGVLDITGDIDIRADAALSSWASGAEQTFVAKFTTTGNQRSYRLWVGTSGFLQLSWSADGTAVLSASSTIRPTPTASGRLAVRATLDADDGAGNRVIKFYTAPTMAGPWTQLGSTVTTAGTTSIFSSTAVLEVGSHTAGTGALLAGLVHAAQVRSSIDGLARADVDFDAQAAGAASFVDDAGLTWTVHGNAEVVGAFVAGTDTTLWVVTLLGPAWTTEAGEFPLDLVAAGVRLRATAIGALIGNAQAVTVNQAPVNGVSKTIPGGEPVAVWRPAVRAL